MPIKGDVSVTWPKGKEAVAVVTLENEKIANALDMGMMAKLRKMEDQLHRARAVILTGAGKDHFCAGANIKEWAAMSPQKFSNDWVAAGLEAFTMFNRLPGVVIGAINGTCFGGGLEIALHTDVRIASTKARFAFPETGLGIIPGWNGGPLLSAATNYETAARVVLLGEILDAKAACTAGLVSETVAPTKLTARSLELAEAAMLRSPAANAEAKKLMLADFSKAAKEHKAASLKVRKNKECDEGINAFMEKRKPRY